MQLHRVALVLLSINLVVARRVKKASTREVVQDQLSTEGKKSCKITENAESLKYGIKGSWQVRSCIFCKFHQFLTETLSRDVISAAEQSDDKHHCKCYTSPRFWEAKGLDRKLWFQFDADHHSCSINSCKEVFLTWANMFNKKSHYPGDNERVPLAKYVENQHGYDLTCDDSRPEGLHLPSPGAKVLELRMQIEECEKRGTDPEECARLKALLEELLADKDVEVWDYAVDEEWGPEREVDESTDGEHHTFFLKPCKSQRGGEVTEFHEIVELCGNPVVGVSLKPGILRVHYVVDEPWGPERNCVATEEGCQLIRNIIADEGHNFEVLSFRLRPCKSSSGKETTELSEIFQEKGCGNPTTKHDGDGFATLLPVKIDVSHNYDQAANFAEGTELKYPCN